VNAEKELLLALLIEKYTAVKETKPASHKQKNTATKKKKKYSNKHMWTDQEKLDLIYWAENKIPFEDIAMQLGLRRKQVESMHYNVTKVAGYAKPVQHVG